MLGFRGYVPPAGQENLASITPFGGGDAGTFQYKRSTVVQRVQRHSWRPGSLSYNQDLFEHGLEQGPLNVQMCSWGKVLLHQLQGAHTSVRGQGLA